MWNQEHYQILSFFLLTFQLNVVMQVREDTLFFVVGAGTGWVELYPHPDPISKVIPILTPTPIPIRFLKSIPIPIPIGYSEYFEFYSAIYLSLIHI